MQDYEEISLRDLILLLVKGWKLIVSTTLIVLGIAILVFFMTNSTTFTTSTLTELTFKPEFTSKYGQYTLPQSKAEDFIGILKDESFMEYLSATTEIDNNRINTILTFTPINTNEFSISISSENDDEAMIIMRTLEEHSEDYINFIVSEKMFSTFETSLKTKLIGMEKNRFDKQKMITYFEAELVKTNPLLNNNLINPVFSSLSSHLVQAKATIAELDFSMLENKEFSTEIKDILEKLATFEDYLRVDQKLDTPHVKLDFKDAKQSESQRFSAKTLFPVSLILGIMLGIFVVFFKNYWTSSSNQ